MIRRLPTRRALVRARMILAAAGLVLSVPALLMALSLGTGAPLDPIGSQTRGLSRGIAQLDAALTNLQGSLIAAGASLDNGRQASTDASAMTASLATAMSELSAASSVQVLGLQPFAQLAPRFLELATRSPAVALSLSSTADSLGSTRAELTALQADVGALRDTLGQVGPGAPSLLATRLLLALLVVWVGTTSGVTLLTALRELR